MSNVCCVVDQFCSHPANLEGARSLKSECFICGQSVCSSCSSRRKYLHYGRVRVCNDCQIDSLDGGSDSRVMNRLRRMAGVK